MKTDPVLLGLSSAPKKNPIGEPPPFGGPKAPMSPAATPKPGAAPDPTSDTDDTAESHQQLDTILKGDPQTAAAIAMLLDALGGGAADATEDASEPPDGTDGL